MNFRDSAGYVNQELKSDMKIRVVMTITSFLVFGLSLSSAIIRGESVAGIAESREVEIIAPDGVKLKGTFFSANRPGPGVILFHMCDGKGRDGWSGVASLLAREGFHTLTFNYRGVGDSEGERFQGGSLQEVMNYWRTKWGADMETAFNLLLSQPGVDKNLIGAGGASCGVYMSLLLAQKHPREVKSLVLLAGPVDAEAKAFVEKSDHLPILGATSEEDARSTAWTREILASSKNKSSRLVVYNGAGHGTNMLAREKSLEPMIIEFFKTSLSK